MQRKTKYSAEQLIEFNKIFPNEPMKSPLEYLSGSNKKDLLSIATSFLSFNATGKSRKAEDFIKMVFGPENEAIAQHVYDVAKNMEKNEEKTVTFTSAQSGLELFQIVFEWAEEKETQTNSQVEISFFKAFLALHSELTRNQEVAFTSTDHLDDTIRAPMMIFCSTYPFNDKENYDIKEILISQMYKAVYFFRFIENDSRFKALLKEFLDYYNCSTWEEYLKRYLPFALDSLKNPNGFMNIQIEQGEDFDKACEFIEKFTLKNGEKLIKEDFLSLRSMPFYKISKGVYQLIFRLFVVEKIFKGIYFTFRDLPEGKKIKQLKTYIGEEFSEHELLYKIVSEIYPNKRVHMPGKHATLLGNSGAADYYMRSGKDFLLFESKDFIIPKEDKITYDFNVYNKAFGKTLYKKDDGKPKAVLQLINVIKKVLKKEFKFDTKYNSRNINIYPIILVHDHQYNVAGFNELINSWFQVELKKLKDEGFLTDNIRPITIINIDSLIYYQVGLREDIPLHTLIDLYWKMKTQKYLNNNKFSIKAYENIFFSKTIPFSYFIKDYFGKDGKMKLPPILKTYSTELKLK
ncbi:MAG: hypothetical protein JWN78_778 [Bacteroidota bacterium]|nr:hypothetical protein [Bacteroidota bacterium]